MSLKQAIFNIFEDWWSRQDSNLRPPPCKGGTLPTELQDHDSSHLENMLHFNKWVRGIFISEGYLLGL